MTNTATPEMQPPCCCDDTCVHLIDGRGQPAPVRERRQSPPDTEHRGEPMDPEDEERFVRAVLARAAGEPGRAVATFGAASVSAYEALAEQRGVSLETVARAVARGRLADVVRLPVVPPEKRA